MVGAALDEASQTQRVAGWEGGFGLTVEFTSFPDVHLAVESLESRQQGIELLNVRHVGEETLATVWIPEGRLQAFERKIVGTRSKERT